MSRSATPSSSRSRRGYDLAHLIDTSVAIAFRDGEPAILDAMETLKGALLLSVISLVELEGGVERDASEAKLRRERLDSLLPPFVVLPFDRASAEAYGRIVKSAGYSRRKLLDRMIAAQALVQDATLVTLNAADVRDIPGLQLMAW